VTPTPSTGWSRYLPRLAGLLTRLAAHPEAASSAVAKASATALAVVAIITGLQAARQHGHWHSWWSTWRRGWIIGKPHPFHKLRLSLHDGTKHVWCLGPIGSGKTWWLAGLVLQAIRRRKPVACIAVDPNGMLTEEVLARLTPEERDRVVVVDPLADNPPPINLMSAKDPAAAAEFLIALFNSIRSGGDLGTRQTAMLRRALVGDDLEGLKGLFDKPGATLLDLPRWLRDHAESAEQGKVAASIVDSLSPFFHPAIRKIIGRPEASDLFEAVDRQGCVLIRMREELGEAPAQLLAAVVLARAWDTIRRRNPKQRNRHVLIVLDELGALVKHGSLLSRMLDQARSRNCCVVCAHQRLSQLTQGVGDALMGSALTRIVMRLADGDEARVMAKMLHPSHVDAEAIMDLRDFRAWVRIRSHGKPRVVKLGRLPRERRKQASAARVAQGSPQIEAAHPPASVPLPSPISPMSSSSPLPPSPSRLALVRPLPLVPPERFPLLRWLQGQPEPPLQEAIAEAWFGGDGPKASRALNKLKAIAVVADSRENPGFGPSRKLWHLTETGRQVLAAQREEVLA
jgi:Type IV secretion-system coupling protein DNA-binding domain